MDCHHRELGLGAELAVCHNDAQLAKAKTCHAATALQLAHLDNISALNHEAMAEEGQKCQAFIKKFSASLQACPPEDHWALMYPLQLLIGNIPLVPLLGMPPAAQLQATTDTGSIAVPLTLSTLGTPMPQPGIKCHSYNQGMPEQGKMKRKPPVTHMKSPTPHKKQKPMVKAFKEAQ